MNVLFVSSGNSRYDIVPFVKSQGESLMKEGIKLDYFTIKGKGINGYLKNIKPLRQYLKENKYDIVHAHYGLVGLLCFLTFTRIPIILSVMGDDAYGCFNQKGKRAISSYYGMFLTQIALIFAKQIIVKSENILKMIPYKKKCHIIPNGVNFDVFKPNITETKKHSLLFLADPIDPRKNISLVKKAMEFINEKGLKLNNPYPIDHSQFPDYLNNSSVFVLTSFEEGSPNVIKEAMACNIPIVSTDVGDVREVIGNTEGCYITTFIPENVANKLQLALEFSLKKGRTKGRERIIELGLDSETIAHRIIEVYKKVLDN